MKNFYPILFLLLSSLLFFTSCERELETPLDEKVAIDFLDLSYGNDLRQKMDVFLPAGRSINSTRVFIWVHGGAWIDGDKSEFIQFKPWLENAQQDYAYIALNYRLFDINTRSNAFPTQEEDLKAALSFIKTKLKSWNVSDQVVLAGVSAGGHLVLLHSYKNNSDDLVKATVAYFPVTDLSKLFENNFYTQLLFKSLVGGTPQQNPEAYAASSPLNFVGNNTIPTVFFHGKADDVVPVQQSFLLEERLKKFNVPYLNSYLPDQGHGFTESIYKELMEKTAVFLNGQLP